MNYTYAINAATMNYELPDHELKNKSSNSATITYLNRKNILSQRVDLIYVFTVMEFLILFSLAAVVIVILILKFDKKQTKKVNTVLKKTRDMPPLYLLKSTEQKISLLKAALRYDDVSPYIDAALPNASVYKNQNENNRLIKVQEFKLLSSKYNNGEISLEVYHTKLDELLVNVKKQGRSLELAGL